MTGERSPCTHLISVEDSKAHLPFDVLAWLVLAIVFVLACATFRDYGVPWDAQGETVYGALLLKFYTSGFFDQSAFEFVNFRFYGGGFELPAALLARVSPFGEYETRHLFGAVLGLIGLAGTWRVARKLGGARTGALATILLAATPSWYGHAFINARDVPFASGMICCLLCTLRALDELPKISGWTRLLFGVALGLTISVRVGGVLAILFLLAPIALWLCARIHAGVALADVTRDAARIAVSLVQSLIVAYAVMAVFWPWAVEAPLNPLHALQMFSSFPFDANVLFDGRLIPANVLPASHLPVQLAVRTPELLLALVALAGLSGTVALWKRPRSIFEPASFPIITVAVAAGFPIVYSVVARPVDYNGLRHFLFVLPPLVVLAALAFDRSWNAVRRRSARVALATAFAAACLVQTRAMSTLHPNEYVYFNSLIGGPSGAQGRFELDYWGTSLAEATKRLEDYLDDHNDRPKPGQPPFNVYVCGNVWSAALFFPSWLRPVEHVGEADFQISIAQYFCKHAPGSRRLFEVKRAGAVLSFVEDLRPLRVAKPFDQAEHRPPVRSKPSSS
jgi:hypothetical protein